MPDTGYGHSSSGYGHSGHGDYGHYEVIHCCPLTIDPITWISLLSFIALGTYLLRETVDMSMLGRRKKRSLSEIFIEGKVKTKYYNLV